MNRTLVRITLLMSAFVLVVFTIIVINQSVQVIQLARGVHPVLGNAVLWGLLFVYSALLLMPAVLWLRLPKQLQRAISSGWIPVPTTLPIVTMVPKSVFSLRVILLLKV